MGLKINIVIIEGRPSCSIPDLVESLGFKNIDPCQNALLGEYINPDKGFIAVAYWKNYTVIAHDTLPTSIINLDFSEKRYFTEITLRRYFDSKNLLAALLHSVTNSYGMCLKNGSGNSIIWGHSGGFHWSRGKRTPIEMKYLEHSYVNSDNEVIYLVDGNEFTQDQIGEDIVLWNVEHFTGKSSGELFDLEAQVFKVSDEHLIQDL